MKRAKGKTNISIVKDMLEGNRPFIQVGYTAPTDEVHNEGDIWTDHRGKMWIKTDGGVRSHNPQADMIRLEVNKMWICKKCECDVRWSNNPHDEKFILKTGRCFDCTIEHETNLKIEGKFKEYEEKKILLNMLSYLKDVNSKLTEAHKYATETQVIRCANSSGLSQETLTRLAFEEKKKDLKEHLMRDSEMVTHAHAIGVPVEMSKEARLELLTSLSSDLEECSRRMLECETRLKELEHVEL